MPLWGNEGSLRSNWNNDSLSFFCKGLSQVTPEQTKPHPCFPSFSLCYLCVPARALCVSSFPSSASGLLKKSKAGCIFGHWALEGSNHGHISTKNLSKFVEALLIPAWARWQHVVGEGTARTGTGSWALGLKGKRMPVPSARKLVLNFVGFALKPKKVVFPLGKLLCRSHSDWHIPPSPSAYF